MRYLLFISFIVFGLSCDPNVVFDNTQPTGFPAIKTIPEQYWGTYRCQSDSTLIIIEPSIAYQQYNYEVRVSLDEIQETENCSLAANGLYLPGRKECFPVQYVHEDTIVAYVTDIDTLFGYDFDQQVLKNYKGSLIINQKMEDDNWMVWTLSMNLDGSLQLNYLDIPEDVNKMSDISKDFDKIKEGEVERYILRPTVKEFDEIVKNEKYQLTCDVLIPVSLEIDRVFGPQ